MKTRLTAQQLLVWYSLFMFIYVLTKEAHMDACIYIYVYACTTDYQSCGEWGESGAITKNDNLLS